MRPALSINTGTRRCHTHDNVRSAQAAGISHHRRWYPPRRTRRVTKVLWGGAASSGGGRGHTSGHRGFAERHRTAATCTAITLVTLLPPLHTSRRNNSHGAARNYPLQHYRHQCSFLFLSLSLSFLLANPVHAKNLQISLITKGRNTCQCLTRKSALSITARCSSVTAGKLPPLLAGYNGYRISHQTQHKKRRPTKFTMTYINADRRSRKENKFNMERFFLFICLSFVTWEMAMG